MNRNLCLTLTLASAISPVLIWGQAAPQSYTISTVVGTGTGGFSGDGGSASGAQLNSPLGITLSGGTLYIADQLNYNIRAVSVANGTISTFAGVNTKGYSGDAGAATKAQLTNPTAVGLGASGNVYIADAGNNVVRLVASNGNISTIAGDFNTGGGYSGDGALATGAQLNVPYSVVVDAKGVIYIADSNNNRIRKVTTDGLINTFAGTGTPEYSGDGGPASAAWINHPESMAFDSAGNLYFSDTGNHVIRKVDANGVITTVVGNHTPAFSGDGGLATAASLDRPGAIAFDGSGNLYIADTFNQRIRVVLAKDQTIHTIAGNGDLGYSGDGSAALIAAFRFPQGIAVDSTGNVYVSDTANNVIRKLTPQNIPVGSQPVINMNGIVSASAYAILPSSAPGSWIEIYGSNLAQTSRGWTTSDFSGISAPISLDGVSVTVGGQPAYLSYVSPGQIDALIPSNVQTGTQTVIVSTPFGSSTAYSLTVNAVQPELAAPGTINLNGKQYVAAFFNTGQIDLPINDPVNTRRAKANDVLIFYGIGFGPLTPEADAGQLVSQLNTLSGFTISIGGVPARVLYAGVSPMFVGQGNFNVGMYQFNVQVPTGITAGDAVPVTFTLNGVAGTQTLYTAITN